MSAVVGSPEGAHRCASRIEKQCMRGDHRRCAVGACTVSTRWHDEVRDAGIAAAQAAGRAWAVVSTIPDDVLVVGTSDDVGRAELVLRGELRRVGDPDRRGQLYLVRGSDGGFL